MRSDGTPCVVQRTRGGFLPCRRRRTAAIAIRAGQLRRLTTTTLGGGSESACCVSKTRMPAMNVPRSPPRSGWYARMNCLRRRSVSFIQPSPASPPPHHRIALRRKTVPPRGLVPALPLRYLGARDFPTATQPTSLRPPKTASEPWRTLVPDIHPACDAGWFVRGGMAPGRRSPPSLTVTGVRARWTRLRQSGISPPRTTSSGK